MRFLVMAIYEEGASGAEAAAEMTAYHKSLQKAGVLLARDGLFPPDTGARISFTDGKPMVTDGPFARRDRGSPDSRDD